MIKLFLMMALTVLFIGKEYKIVSLETMKNQYYNTNGQFNFFKNIEPNNELYLRSVSTEGKEFIVFENKDKLFQVIRTSKDKYSCKEDEFLMINDSIFFLAKRKKTSLSYTVFPEGYGNHSIVFLPTKREIMFYYSNPNISGDSLIAILKYK